MPWARRTAASQPGAKSGAGDAGTASRPSTAPCDAGRETDGRGSGAGISAVAGAAGMRSQGAGRTSRLEAFSS